MLIKCTVKGADAAKAAVPRRLSNGCVIPAHKHRGFVDSEKVYIAPKVYFQLAAKYMRYIAFAHIKSVSNIGKRNIRTEILLAVVKNFTYNAVIQSLALFKLA